MIKLIVESDIIVVRDTGKNTVCFIFNYFTKDANLQEW